MRRVLVFTGVLYLTLSPLTAHAGLGFFKLFLAKTHPTCKKAEPPYHTSFCKTFETAARCACTSSGAPASFCEDMKSLHHRMLMIFTTQLAACQFQHDTSVQNCLDSWKCYRNGGKDSAGRLCQSTGAACSHSA